jgi:hypothetical protein
MYSSAATDRLTCQMPGKYMIGGNVRAIVATGNWAFDIALNGSAIIGMAAGPPYPVIGQRMALSVPYNLAAGDYVQLRFYQDTGATVNIEAADNYSPEFWVQRFR